MGQIVFIRKKNDQRFIISPTYSVVCCFSLFMNALKNELFNGFEVMIIEMIKFYLNNFLISLPVALPVTRLPILFPTRPFLIATTPFQIHTIL